MPLRLVLGDPTHRGLFGGHIAVPTPRLLGGYCRLYGDGAPGGRGDGGG